MPLSRRLPLYSAVKSYFQSSTYCHNHHQRYLTTNCFPLRMPKTVQSKYEYVRAHEASSESILLPDCYLIVRVDGKNFHTFSTQHKFWKPNDKRALDLMAQSARSVMAEFAPHILISYGQSDEMSFVINKGSKLYSRRSSKIMSVIVSHFSAAYVFHWKDYFDTSTVLLQYPPTFDARVVVYPSERHVKDYLKWRQVDCHVNNLYNTVYHALTGEYTAYELLNPEGGDITDDKDDYRTVPFEQLVQNNLQEGKIQSLPANPPLTGPQATHRLSGSVKKDKHDIMFQEYGINYNNELNQFRKGTLLVLKVEEEAKSEQEVKEKVYKKRKGYKDEEKPPFTIQTVVDNIIDDSFWESSAILPS